jgi:hypothetical protein
VSLSHPALGDSQTSGLSRRQLEQAKRVETENALELHKYKHGAYVRKQIDIYDSYMVAEVNEAAATSEMEMLDHCLHRAGISAAKVEMTARAAQRVATINDRRIMRRFGMEP